MPKTKTFYREVNYVHLALKELYLSNTAASFGDVFTMDSNFLNAVRKKPLKVFDISQTSYSFVQKR